jgi:hypothetical protein
MTRRCGAISFVGGVKIIEINFGNAMQTMVLAKVKNKMSRKFISDYLLMIVGAG